jgi:DNA uptake protein ComE-like DNA-binding protein
MLMVANKADPARLELDLQGNPVRNRFLPLYQRRIDLVRTVQSHNSFNTTHPPFLDPQNSADVEKLMGNVPLLAEVKAKAIVAYREEHG